MEFADIAIRVPKNDTQFLSKLLDTLYNQLLDYEDLYMTVVPCKLSHALKEAFCRHPE